MSATKDVSAYLADMKPAPGQSVESFAKQGLSWQAEIYSSNAGMDLPMMGWFDISEADREGWRRWARERGAGQ